MKNFLQKTKKTILTLAIMLTISSSVYSQTVTWKGTKTFNENTTIDTDIKLDGIVTVDVAEGVWVTLNGKISDLIVASSITKTGAGDLYLSATSQASYTGPTIINAGTFWYYGGFSQASIINNAHLVQGNSVDLVYNGVISGTGHLTKHGTGKLVLTGENTYQGVTVINAGTLQIGNGATGSIKNTAGVHIFEPGTLRFEPDEDCVFSAGIGGEGKVEYVGNNDKKLFFTANNSYTGTTTIDGGGVITIGNGGTTGAIVGDVIINDGWFSFKRSDDYTYSGIISGNGHVTKWGASKTTLTGKNTYTGKTVVFQGKLQIGDGISGSIDNTSDVLINDTYSILRFEPGESIFFWRDIAGAGSLEYKGDCIEKGLGLYGNNTYSGTTTNEAGSLVIGCWWTGSGSVTSNSIINHGILHFDHGDAEYAYSGVISGTGDVHIRNAKTTLKGNNTYTGETHVYGKALKIDGSIENSKTVRLYGEAKLDVSAGNKKLDSLVMEPNTEVMLGSAILTIGGNAYCLGIFSGEGGVTKIGTGSVSMLGENTAKGMLTLNGGYLELTKRWAGNFTQAAGTNFIVTENAIIGGTCLLMGGRISMDLTKETPSKLIVIGAASVQGTTTLNITSPEITDYVLIAAASGLDAKKFALGVPESVAKLSSTGTELSLTAYQSMLDIASASLSNQITVYPNPTNGELRMENGELRINSVEIFDVFGRKISLQFIEGVDGAAGRGSKEVWQPQADGVVIDLTVFPSGVYFVRIATEQGIVTKKIIKQ